MHQTSSRAPGWRAITICSLLLAVLIPGKASAHWAPRAPVLPETISVSSPPVRSLPVPDSLFGSSGKLRFRLFSSSSLFALPILETLFGNANSDARPGVYQAAEDIMGRPFAFISMIPFATKAGGRMGDYRVGFWPAEKKRKGRSEAYQNPEGFIEVTPENQDTYVSEHFRLRDFLTHDQKDVWPKYLVLRACRRAQTARGPSWHDTARRHPRALDVRARRVRRPAG